MCTLLTGTSAYLKNKVEIGLVKHINGKISKKNPKKGKNSNDENKINKTKNNTTK